jgi:DNA-binding CsgD family transcriptional regulator
VRQEELSDKLLDLIYEAATDTSLWVPAFREIASLTNSTTGVMLVQSATHGMLLHEHHYGASDESLRVLKERHVLNPWTRFMWKEKPPIGAVVRSDGILPLSELRSTAFYDEVLRSQDLGHSAMIGLGDRPELGVGFSMNRGPRPGPYDDAEVGLLARLAPHMYRSLKLCFRIGAYKALQRAEYLALDSLAVGVIVLDRKARILFANVAARLLDGDDGPLSLRHAKVAHISPHSSRRLDDLVQAALRGKPMGAISVPCADGGHSLTIVASDVRASDVDRLADANLPDAAVILFIINPTNKAGIPVDWLMDAYGMTQAEAKVALAVSSGLSIPETGRELGLSPNTIKTQLRNVFAKSGVGRQTELARLIASIGLLKARGPS